MDLNEIRKYRVLLNMKKALCFGLTFVSLTQLGTINKELKSKEEQCISTIELSEDISLEALSDIDTEEVLVEKVVEIKNVAKKALSSKKVEIIKEDVESVEPTYPEKIDIICENLKCTKNQLHIVLATGVAEACDDGYNYDEAYNTISTFYNRIHDIGCVNYVNGIYGNDAGYNIYYQCICPGQFCAYGNGSYLKYLGNIDLPGYQAGIDMLYSGIPSHNYLHFNNVPPQGVSYERLVPNKGNYYSVPQREENIILDETRSK